MGKTLENKFFNILSSLDSIWTKITIIGVFVWTGFKFGCYYKETQKLIIGPVLKGEIPVRMFPLQPYDNGNKNWVSVGIFATKDSPNDIKLNIKDVFETFPEKDS